MAFRQTGSIEIKRVKGKGRGVFARCLIRKGELIEKVPMLVFNADEYEEGISKTCLSKYCFQWQNGKSALALGYGSLYNHSYAPNARYDDVWPNTKEFTAIRDIEPGEEITINYNGSPKSRTKVWFDVVEPAQSPQRNGTPTRKT